MNYVDTVPSLPKFYIFAQNVAKNAKLGKFILLTTHFTSLPAATRFHLEIMDLLVKGTFRKGPKLGLFGQNFKISDFLTLCCKFSGALPQFFPPNAFHMNGSFSPHKCLWIEQNLN